MNVCLDHQFDVGADWAKAWGDPFEERMVVDIHTWDMGEGEGEEQLACQEWRRRGVVL